MNPVQNTHWRVEAETAEHALVVARARAEADGYAVVREGGARPVEGHPGEWFVTLGTRR